MATGSAARASAAEDAVRQERARIGRELHDSVSQTLYAIILAASRARSLSRRNQHAEIQHVIEDLLQLANDGQAELRALMTDMRPSQLTAEGLNAALTTLAVDVQKRHGLDIRLSLGQEPDISADAMQQLATIGREALHNVVKHGGADHVDIALEYDVDRLALIITDDGQGFDPAAPRPGHFGLQSMRERAAAIGGMLEVLSSEGAGTQVRVRVPRHAIQSAGRPQIVA